MKLKPLKVIAFALIVMVTFSCKRRDFICTLSGTVLDRNSDRLILNRTNEDMRFAKIFIPIVNGKFEYKLLVKTIEAWELTFMDEVNNGGWRSIVFFPDKRAVRFELFPFDQYDRNKITGGQVNKYMVEYNKALLENFDSRLELLEKNLDSLNINHLYWSSEFYQLNAQRDSSKIDAERDSLLKAIDLIIKQGKHKTKAAVEIEKKFNLISLDEAKYRYQYINEHINIFSYSLILRDLLRLQGDSIKLNEIQKIYPVFAGKFPDHPYTTLIRDIINGLDKIKIGGHFVDFTLPDLNGGSQTLSELIKGKVAVINLWATWCGPCIKHSREMVPVYQDYQDKGFTIVGIAAEIKDTEAMKKRLEREKWPWINLVELDHQNHIWDKYGASFGGGKIIMVDKNGVILAINPTAEEVRKKLEEIL
jgi:thiol-disulfide isomerase/thioredoxin